MSLLRLLAAGKSLVGMQDTASPYRLSKHAVLPKFISAKNPFASSAEQQAAPQTEVRNGATHAAALKETKKLPVLVVRGETRLPQPKTPQTPSRAARGWIRKLNPLSLFAALKPAPQPARAAFTKAPVQGELSLDKVKVVRNDLSDADLEVVPVKSSTAKRSADSVLPPVATSKPAGTPWEQLSTRIFGAGQT